MSGVVNTLGQGTSLSRADFWKCQHTLQHTAAQCSTLQHTASTYSQSRADFRKWQHTLQHTAEHRSTLQYTAAHLHLVASWFLKTSANPATHCSKLQYTATTYSTDFWECVPFVTCSISRERVATSLFAFILSAEEYISQKSARCSVLQCVAVCCSALQRVVLYCSMLQCVAVCCRVLQCVSISLPIFALRASTILKTQHYGCLTWWIESRLDSWISTSHVGVWLCLERQKFWKVKSRLNSPCQQNVELFCENSNRPSRRVSFCLGR